MDLKIFKAEAKKLARSGILLKESGEGKPIAYWHGVKNNNICISFKQSDTWLNIYIDNNEGGHVEFSNTPLISTIPLYGVPYNSLPPVDGVFFKGSNLIDDFLKIYDWPREEPFNDNFPDPVPANYETFWQNSFPIYQKNIVAVIGGWHMPWPDDDWYDLVDHELVIWTMKDSEPWVEVFFINGKYVVKQRTT